MCVDVRPFRVNAERVQRTHDHGLVPFAAIVLMLLLAYSCRCATFSDPQPAVGIPGGSGGGGEGGARGCAEDQEGALLGDRARSPRYVIGRPRCSGRVPQQTQRFRKSL